LPGSHRAAAHGAAAPAQQRRLACTERSLMWQVLYDVL
jgi:hypothetical protein